NRPYAGKRTSLDRRLGERVESEVIRQGGFGQSRVRHLIPFLKITTFPGVYVSDGRQQPGMQPDSDAKGLFFVVNCANLRRSLRSRRLCVLWTGEESGC